MGGILGACNAISDYLHTLNMGSTLFRLILAMFLGCLIGIDRGMKKRVAGVKTHMIVCMGATLVMMTGDFIHVYSNGAGIGDTARLGAQVVSGIGFLGVGTIIVTGQRHVSGLTTAASLWNRLLQRCDLYHAGAYSGVQICEIYRGLCGRAFQYL